MAITFTCIHCKKTISVKAHQAGKKGPCPKCHKPIVVPMQSTASPVRRDIDDAELEAMAMAVVAQEPAEPGGATVVEHTCPYCDAKLRFPANLAGRNAPCPECKHVIKVPQLAPTGPRDWRKPEAQTGPSGAKPTEAQAQAQQEWASQAAPAHVSQQALVEARAVPIERERLTVGQWVKRGVVAATLLIIIGGGVAWYLGFRRERFEERALASAEKAAAAGQKAGWAPELQAEYQACLGLYYYRAGKSDEKGRGALPRFQLARQAADRVADPIERFEVIREVLNSMIEADIDTDEMGALLSEASPEAREDLFTELTRRLATGSADRVAKIRQIIQRAAPAQLRQVAPPNDAAKKDGGTSGPNLGAGEMDYSEQLACLGAVGLELMRLGHAEAGSEFADATVSVAKNARTVPIPVLALWMLTNKPVPEAGVDAETRQAAQVAAFARSKNLPKAKAVLDTGLKATVALRLATVLDLAETLFLQGDKPEALAWVRHAVTLLEPLRLEETVRERQKLMELLAAIGDAEASGQLGNKLLPANSLAAQRARVAAFRLTALQSKQPVDTQHLKEVATASGPAAVVAFLAGQHNARINPGDALRWVETTEPDSIRAFAALGAAVGIAEQRK